MKKVIVCLGFFAFASCSTQHHGQSNQKSTVVASERDGSSFDKAIIIEANNDKAGAGAEYAWLKEHYPNYQMGRQSLAKHNGKPYDILNIKTQDGQEKSAYFDISNSFGK